MSRLKTGMAIVAQSLALLRVYPKLLLFPILNFIGMVLLVAFFALPVLFETSVFTMGDELAVFNETMQARGEEGREANAESGDGEPVTIGRVTFTDDGVDIPYLVLGVIYLMTMFLLTFLNVAFYAEILQAFNGNPVSLMRGIAFATSRLRAIFLWSLMAGLVGLVIRQLEEKVGIVGKWVLALIGFSWSVAAVFAIPVIIRDTRQDNPLATLKTSAAIIKQTWGEGLTGVVSITVVTVLLFMLVIPLFIVLMIIAPVAAMVLMIACATTLFALGYLSAVIKDVFLCGLYVYATEGVVPGAFEPDLLEHAWQVKKRKA